MARAERLDLPGGAHHVMNRGAGRRVVFHTARDGHRFLALVGEACDRFGVVALAFCLMPNHYHLLLRCPEGGLSEFMQHVGAMYTRYVNWRTDSDGPIFRGRFRSLNVDSPQYLDTVGRYIHRNPIDLRPPVQLDQYRWSSLRYYTGVDKAPTWLQTDELAEMHAGHSGYREFVVGDRTPSPDLGALAWQVDVALMVAGQDEHIEAPGVGHTIALLVAPELFEFTNDAARRAALYRARRRAREDPALMEIARYAAQAA